MNTVKIVYWITTVLLALLLVGSAFADITLAEPIVAGMTKVGIPLFLMPFFGVMKILGIITILLPALGRLREGAYAGIIFYAIGAIYVHICAGDAIAEMAGAFTMFILVITSYLTSLKVKGLYAAK